jgi:hypothetical protein
MPGWKVFQPNDEQFMISMPGIPEEETETMQTSFGSIDLRLAGVTLGEDLWEPLIFFSVSYGELPTENQWEQKAVLSEASKIVIDALEGDLVSKKEITYQKCRGTELVAKLGESNLARIRSYICNNILYQLVVGGERLEVLSEDVGDRFFNSFKLE